MRESNFPMVRDINYRLPMGNGFFRVKFFLAERAFTAPGLRQLDLTIEGTRLAELVDVFDEVGFEAAFERGFDIEVTDGLLNIDIHAAPNQRALVAALEIETLGPGHFEQECFNDPNSTGVMSSVSFVGNTSVGDDDLEFSVGPLAPSSFGFFIQAELSGVGNLPAGGVLCVSQPFFRLPAEQADADGFLRHELQIQNPNTPAQQILAGSTWRFQAWHRDTTPNGYGLSNALKLVFTP